MFLPGSPVEVSEKKIAEWLIDNGSAKRTAGSTKNTLQPGVDVENGSQHELGQGEPKRTKKSKAK